MAALLFNGIHLELGGQLLASTLIVIVFVNPLNLSFFAFFSGCFFKVLVCIFKISILLYF